jgi:hypothetical protein
VVWGQKKFKPGPFYTGRFSIPIAWIAIIFLLFGIVLSMFPTGGPSPSAAEMNYTVVINCAVWGGALLYYYIDARKWKVARPLNGAEMIANISTGSLDRRSR